MVTALILLAGTLLCLLAAVIGLIIYLFCRYVPSRGRPTEPIDWSPDHNLYVPTQEERQREMDLAEVHADYHALVAQLGELRRRAERAEQECSRVDGLRARYWARIQRMQGNETAEIEVQQLQEADSTGRSLEVVP